MSIAWIETNLQSSDLLILQSPFGDVFAFFCAFICVHRRLSLLICFSTMPIDPSQFEQWMDLALDQAAKAQAAGDVPIGAVIVRSAGGAADAGRVIAAEHNRRIIDADPTAHAEMLAIRAAAAALGDWRLAGCTMAVTLEPCCMCAGAIVLARLDRLVYGAQDAKAGAVDTLYRLCSDQRLNHRLETVGGVRAGQCGAMLTEFFRKQRAMGKKWGRERKRRS